MDNHDSKTYCDLKKDMYRYIAEYMNEEIERGNTIDECTVEDAVQAYKGGAR